jgi:hypothetical protein
VTMMSFFRRLLIRRLSMTRVTGMRECYADNVIDVLMIYSLIIYLFYLFIYFLYLFLVMFDLFLLVIYFSHTFVTV